MRAQSMPVKHSAFSLIELSLVLVILGLLTGGILAGQALIRAAELRSVSNDFNRYNTAIYTFRDKYFALPGDMTNATSFWDSAGGDGKNATCYSTVPTPATRTCNGNGDGGIDSRNADLGGNYAGAEPLNAWKHLSNAGLIEGSYPAITTGNAYPLMILGVTMPRSRISNAGFMIADTRTGWSNGLTGSRLGNTLFFGALDANAGVRNPVISPEEAWNIDTKMDDGNAETGRIVIDSYSTAVGCYTGTSPNRTYALSTSGTQCALRYLIM